MTIEWQHNDVVKHVQTDNGAVAARRHVGATGLMAVEVGTVGWVGVVTFC